MGVIYFTKFLSIIDLMHLDRMKKKFHFQFNISVSQEGYIHFPFLFISSIALFAAKSINFLHSLDESDAPNC